MTTHLNRLDETVQMVVTTYTCARSNKSNIYSFPLVQSGFVGIKLVNSTFEISALMKQKKKF